MRKRRASVELTKDNAESVLDNTNTTTDPSVSVIYNDDTDDNLRSSTYNNDNNNIDNSGDGEVDDGGRIYRPGGPIKFRSKEEVVASGKKIIRLARSNPSNSRPPTSLPPTLPAVSTPSSDKGIQSQLTVPHHNTIRESPPSSAIVADSLQEDTPPISLIANKDASTPTTTVTTAAVISSTDGNTTSNGNVAASSKSDDKGGSNSDGERGAAVPSVFGSLFNQPFTNPFAEIAAKSSQVFAPTSVPSSSGNGIAAQDANNDNNSRAIPINCNSDNPYNTENSNNDDDDDTNNNGSGQQQQALRPAKFPGEEDEAELFVENNAILLKCVPVVQDGEAANSHPSTTGTDSQKPQPSMKWKKMGEGTLKLLKAAANISKSNGVTSTKGSAATAVSEAFDVTKDNKSDQCRLVLRQKGTWSVLLNTPLSISKKFDDVPQLSIGYGVRFVGLASSTITNQNIDQSNHSVGGAEDKVETTKESGTAADTGGSTDSQTKQQSLPHTNTNLTTDSGAAGNGSKSSRDVIKATAAGAQPQLSSSSKAASLLSLYILKFDTESARREFKSAVSPFSQ